MAEIDDLRVRLQRAESERYWLRDEVKALKQERSALIDAGDVLAAIAEHFWVPSPCEEDGGVCSICEMELFGALYEQRQAWLTARGQAE